jgi:hypothetical protein
MLLVMAHVGAKREMIFVGTAADLVEARRQIDEYKQHAGAGLEGTFFVVDATAFRATMRGVKPL